MTDASMHAALQTEQCNEGSGTHRRKSGARSAVVLLICLYINTVLPSCTASFLRPSSLSLQWPMSSYKCVYDSGQAETRVCQFNNLIMHKGQLMYIYSGDLPVLPHIMTNWHHNLFLALTTVAATDISTDIANAPVQHVTQATLTHRQWHLNYYHSIAESVFEVFNLACVHFQLCNLHSRSDFVPVFLDKPGIADWDQRKGDATGSWRVVLPAAAEALQCFYPKPALGLADLELHEKVIAIETAVAGIGPYNRKWAGPHDMAKRFHEVYKPVDIAISQQYQRGLLKCMGVKPAKLDSQGPFKVTIMDRQYHSGRHIMNVDSIADNIAALRSVQSCSVMDVDSMTFKQQVSAFASSQVVIMTHGASLASVMFMSPGSLAVFYNWLDVPRAPHSWVTDVIQDYDVQAKFVGLSTRDRRFIHPQKEMYIYRPEYALLTAQQKIALLEEGICPEDVQLPGCDVMKLNFAIDWQLLKPALARALNDLQRNDSQPRLYSN